MGRLRNLGRHLLRGLCATTVTLVALVGLSVLCVPKDNTASAGMYEVQARGILGEPDDTIDVVFVGDSEVYSGFSPLKMWIEQGFTAYDCSTSAQKMCFGNALLRQATTRQHPRLVVIEANALFRRFSISSSILQELGNVLPVFEYHDRWKELTAADLTLQIAHTYVEPLKGYLPRWGAAAAEEGQAEDEGEMLGYVARLNRMYLKRMVDYCREIGATPVLVSAPSTVNMTPSRHMAIERIAEGFGVDYLDLNEHVAEIGIDWETDTFDKGDHMNFGGAQKVSAYLAAYLSEAYDLPDHRGDTFYAAWADTYDSYHEEYAEYGG